jgi:2-amino-4-hydroxy-6-hydroxymethyldihydropteridine diphosphokinase
MVTCYIGIGSNLGNRRYYIDTAIRKIRMLTTTRVKKTSRIVESLPQGGPSQGPYLNAVLEMETELSPYQLLQELQKIESGLGRVRVVKDGPRTIDLDILTYGELSINESALCIPHPRILERDFVLNPLKEIAPHIIDRLYSHYKEVKNKKAKAKTTSKKLKVTGKRGTYKKRKRARKNKRD